MNVLLIGSGGREHTIAYKICKSKLLKKLYTLPGNPGTATLGDNVKLDVKDHKAVVEFCLEKNIDLVVIGPEQPLVDDLAGSLRDKAISVFGPDAKAAEIEAHKSFAKNLMKKYGIPTAEYVEFGSNEHDKAEEYLKSAAYPLVIKADGLAAGKGVLICDSYEEASQSLREMFVDKVFGSSGDNVVIEEFMTGEEASIFAITDGENYVCLPPAQDHKRIGENDTGKNTGGMGAYSPAPLITSERLNEIKTKVIEPTLAGMKKEGRTFSGCLYCGLMVTDNAIKVVEFNCRFGDPETQAVLPLLEGDFLKLLYSSAEGKLEKSAVNYSSGSAVCVVASSEGYPGPYTKGLEITGLDSVSDEEVVVFHAGTTYKDGKTVTSGGRVLGVTSIIKENDLKKAKEKAYAALTNIKFEGMYFRKDIADKGIRWNMDNG